MQTTTNMTAETLKPFITPTTVDNYAATHSSAASSSRCSRSCYFLAITASVITVILTTALLGIAVWNTMRISNLQTEVQNLNRVIDSMQKRLGLTYLDDLRDFEKEDENNNTLIDDVLPDDDVDDDDDDDVVEDDDDDEEDYDDFDEWKNKFRHYQQTEDEDDEETQNAASVADDNLYDDFEKFNDSKLKRQHGDRKPRSLVNLNAEQENVEENTQKIGQVVLRPAKDSSYSKAFVNSENFHFERRRSPLRVYNSRRRKYPLVKSAKTVGVTANPNDDKPAAHFHITHKVPHYKHHIQISNHNGDVYIGKASLSNELNVDNYFLVEHGVLTVRERGLYYVYAQICYNNNFVRNGFTIFHGDREFLQCLHNSHASNEALINTCHTSGLIYLGDNEQIHIRDLHMNRLTFLSDNSNRSFFGLVKI